MDLEFFLNLFSLLTFTSVEEEQIAKNVETRLINDIKKRNTANTYFSLKNRPEEPVTVTPYLVIRHVIIDEETQMVTINGRFHSIWTDQRWTWNMSDYSNTWYILRTLTDLRDTVWIPELQFSQTRLYRESIGRQDAWVTVYAGGAIDLLTPFSTEIHCDFDGAEYPFDLVKCSIALVTLNDASRLRSDRPIIYFQKDDTSSDWRMIRAQQFQTGSFVGKFIGRKAVASVFGGIFDLKRARNSPSLTTKSLGNRTMFEVAFERRVSYYFGTMLGPLLVMVVLMLVIASLPSTVHTFHFLFGLFACQLLFGCFLASSLPKAYSKLPIIVVLATAAFSVNILTIVLKAVHIHLNNRINGIIIWKRIEKVTVVATVSLPSLLLCTILVHCFKWWNVIRE